MEKVYLSVLDQEEYKKYLEWKNLDEQGKLLKLPCKPGDTVYLLIKNGINDPFIMEWRVENLMYCVEIIPKIGKTVFMTDQEAKEEMERIEWE